MSTADDLARSVAKDLAPEFGRELPTTMDNVISGEQTRGWGHAALAIEICTFILKASDLGWEIYKHVRDVPKVRELLTAEVTPPPEGVTPEKAKLIVDSVIANLPKIET